MNIGTLLYTWFRCSKVGEDKFGNSYYISRFKDSYGKYRRSVIYNGIIEASKIPPMWNAWLRHNTDEIPIETKIYKWQQELKPNLTGTNNAYLPSGHMLKYEQKVNYENKYYKSWKP